MVKTVPRECGCSNLSHRLSVNEEISRGTGRESAAWEGNNESKKCRS
jgi:hypothetical protein